MRWTLGATARWVAISDPEGESTRERAPERGVPTCSWLDSLSESSPTFRDHAVFFMYLCLFVCLRLCL